MRSWCIGIRYLHLLCFLPRPQLCPDLSSMCLISRLLVLLTFHSLLLIFYLYIYTTNPPVGVGAGVTQEQGGRYLSGQPMKYERRRPKYTEQAGDQECSRGDDPLLYTWAAFLSPGYKLPSSRILLWYARVKILHFPHENMSVYSSGSGEWLSLYMPVDIFVSVMLFVSMRLWAYLLTVKWTWW